MEKFDIYDWIIEDLDNLEDLPNKAKKIGNRRYFAVDKHSQRYTNMDYQLRSCN